MNIFTVTYRSWRFLYSSCLLLYAGMTNFTSYFKSSEAVTQCDVTQQVHEAPQPSAAETAKNAQCHPPIQTADD